VSEIKYFKVCEIPARSQRESAATHRHSTQAVCRQGKDLHRKLYTDMHCRTRKALQRHALSCTESCTQTCIVVHRKLHVSRLRGKIRRRQHKVTIERLVNIQRLVNKSSLLDSDDLATSVRISNVVSSMM